MTAKVLFLALLLAFGCLTLAHVNENNYTINYDLDKLFYDNISNESVVVVAVPLSDGIRFLEETLALVQAKDKNLFCNCLKCNSKHIAKSNQGLDNIKLRENIWVRSFKSTNDHNLDSDKSVSKDKETKKCDLEIKNATKSDTIDLKTAKNVKITDFILKEVPHTCENEIQSKKRTRLRKLNEVKDSIHEIQRLAENEFFTGTELNSNSDTINNDNAKSVSEPFITYINRVYDVPVKSPAKLARGLDPTESKTKNPFCENLKREEPKSFVRTRQESIARQHKTGDILHNFTINA